MKNKYYGYDYTPMPIDPINFYTVSVCELVKKGKLKRKNGKKEAAKKSIRRVWVELGKTDGWTM